LVAAILLLSNVSFTGVSFADVLLDVGAGPFLLLQDESSVTNGPEVFATFVIETPTLRILVASLLCL